jgi:hypothetical protein
MILPTHIQNFILKEEVRLDLFFEFYVLDGKNNIMSIYLTVGLEIKIS